MPLDHDDRHMGRRDGLRHRVRIVDQAMRRFHKKRSIFGWALGAIMLALCAATIPVASTYAAPQTASHEADDNQKHGDAHAEGGHSDPFAFILIELAIIVVVASNVNSVPKRFGSSK